MAVTGAANPTLALAGLNAAKQSQAVNASVVQSAVETAAQIASSPPAGSGTSSGAVDISA